MTDADVALNDLAFFALDHAMDSVVASGGPLVPFAVTERDGARSLARFVGDLEQGQRDARASVARAGDVDRAAVAWDGYLTVDGSRLDAVFVEASQAGSAESLLLAQRYHVTGRIRKRIEAVGNPALLPPGGPLF